jgi:hypothetical protein
MKDVTTKPHETMMFGLSMLGLVVLLTIRAIWGAT